MELNVACNWDIELPERLAQYKEVKMLYGNQGDEIIGGGRAKRVISPVTSEYIKRYILKCHQYNLEFQYLLTAPSLSNLEFTVDYRKKIIDFVAWLIDIEVDSIALGNPFLIDMIKQKFPNLPIKGSVFLNGNNIRTIKYYEKIGLSSLVLFFDYNKDIRFLTEIKKRVSLPLQLIVNGTCLYFCPYGKNHSVFLGNSARKGTHNGFLTIDNCMLHCRKMALHQKEKLIMAGNWIRPEDIPFYEQLGFNDFKITDRSSNSDVILKIVDAYVNRKWNGNLMEILTVKAPFDKPDRFEKNINKPNKELLLNKNLPSYYREYLGIELFSGAFPYIENSSLNDNLKKRIQIDCRRISCKQCRCCNEIADNHLIFPESIQQLEKSINTTLNRFYTSYQ